MGREPFTIGIVQDAVAQTPQATLDRAVGQIREAARRAAQITALLGAQVIFYPTAIGWHPAEKAEFGAAQMDAWRTMQRAHAIANGVYVAAPNRVGFEEEAGTDGIEFFGHSFVSDPFGRLIAEAGQEPTILVAKCDPALIEDTRRNWPFLRDRRIDAYAPILNRYLG